MKIDFEGVTRVLDLEHIRLKHATAIQEFTGLAVFAWQERLSGFGDLAPADVEGVADVAGVVRVMRKTPIYTDPAWIMSVAAAHWLMLAQAGEDPPPLDDDYDCDVLSFYLSLLTAYGEELKVKAKRVPDKPDPTARPGRPARSSRPTTPRKPKTVPGEVVALPSPPLTLTGS